MYSNTEIRNKIAAEIMSYRRTAMRLHGYNSNGWLTACSVLRSFAAEFPKDDLEDMRAEIARTRQEAGDALLGAYSAFHTRYDSVDLSDPLAPVRARKMLECWS